MCATSTQKITFTLNWMRSIGVKECVRPAGDRIFYWRIRTSSDMFSDVGASEFCVQRTHDCLRVDTNMTHHFRPNLLDSNNKQHQKPRSRTECSTNSQLSTIQHKGEHNGKDVIPNKNNRIPKTSAVEQ